MMQNTPEMYRGASSQWLLEAAQVFRGDLDTTESIFTGWNPPNLTIENRTEDDLQLTHYNKWQRPKVLTIVELLRRTTFSEVRWDPKTLTRGLMRQEIFARNDIILELGATSGEISRWLNETGWVQSHAYDYSDDIELITFSAVRHLDRGQKPALLGDGDVGFDWILCISEQCPNMLGDLGEEVGTLYTQKGIVLDKTLLEVPAAKDSEGSKDSDGDWLVDMTKYGAKFKLDEDATRRIEHVDGGKFQVWVK